VRAWFLLAAIGSLGACSLLVETGDLAGGGGGASTTSSSSSGSSTGGSGEPRDAGPDAPLPGTVDAEPPVGCPAAGRTCIADAPAGWTGPLVVFDGADADVPVCPASMAVARIDAHRGFRSPAPHGCSECKCGPGSGAACTATVLVKAAGCADDGDPKTLAVGGCVVIPSGNAFTIKVAQTGGSCSPNGGFPSLPPATWDTKTRACGAPSLLRTGCEDGKVCAPDAPTPFRAHHCVSKSGDVGCPGGAPYTEKLVANGIADTRTCAGCTCGTPANECEGKGRIGPVSTSCAVPGATTFDVPNDTCNTGASVSMYLLQSVTPKCEPTSAATPSGTLAPSTPTTICCIP